MLLQARFARAVLLGAALLPHVVCGRPLRVAVDSDLFNRNVSPLKEDIEEFERVHGVQVELVYDNVDDTITDVQNARTVDSMRRGNIDVVTVDGVYTWELEAYIEAVPTEELPEDLRSAIRPEVWKRFQSSSGHQIAFPLYDAYGMLFYRSDLLKRYNISEPGPDGWTWDEVEEIARTVKRLQLERHKSNVHYDFDGLIWQGLDYEGLACVATEVVAGEGGAGFVKPDGEVVLGSDPRIKAAVQRMARWISPAKDNLTVISPAGTLTMEESRTQRRFCADGRAMFARSWPSLARHCNDMGMAGQFGMVKMPSVTRGQGRGVWGGEGLAIAKNSRYPGVARKFIEMALSARWQTFWSAHRWMISVRTDIANNASSCSDMQRTSCRVPLRSLVPGTDVRFPGDDGYGEGSVIVGAPSPLCPEYDHMATVCDVSTAGYGLERPSRLLKSAYEGVSYEFYSAVYDILYSSLDGAELDSLLQRAACKIVSKTKAEQLATPLWAKDCDQCEAGAYLVSDGTCRTCGFFTVSQDCPSTLVYLVVAPAVVLLILLGNCLWFRVWAWADAAWAVDMSELKLGEAPEVLGRGTFGFVLRAEYKDTEVAVKRVMLPDGFEALDAFGAVPDLQLDGDRPMTRRQTKLSRGSDTTVGPAWVAFGRLRSGSSSWGPSPMDNTDVEIGVCRSQTEEPSMMKRSVARTYSPIGPAQLRLDFIHEMRTLSRLRHPCVLTVMGAVVSNRTEPMLVMEYMQHGSLHDLLHNETVDVEGELVLPILCDVSAGLRFLHATQVVHGDLRSQHVLVDSKFRAKICGFGLSQKEKLGIVARSVPWMAPELASGKEEPKTSASDVYAFGALLVEVYTRADPFQGESPQAVLDALQTYSRDPAQHKRPEIPETCSAEIAALMLDCWRRDPLLRPSAAELDRRLKSMDANAADKGIVRRKPKRRTGARNTWDLMCDVFPEHVAEALKAGRKVEPDRRDAVTIFFSDIVGFTDISATLEPQKVSDMLNRLYSKFDALSRELHVFKVETIGDAYMAVANLVEDQATDHARRIALFAQQAIRLANETLVDEDDPGKGHVNIRVGFHSGPVVGNVVGTRNVRYCLFGDTVNTAARMESNSAANRIHCSAASADFLQKQAADIPLLSRGVIHVKGKGSMHTYWVEAE